MKMRPIIVAAIGAALLLGIVLPVATAQAPPCFTFADGQTQAFQCPASFRPGPVQYYPNTQSGFVQATDDNNERLPMGFFDQRTIDTLRQNAAQNQTVTNGNATAAAPANQTASNLTSSDIESVRNALNTVRQSLEHNDTQAIVESINRADGALFGIMLNESKGLVSDRLTKLSDYIDTTRKSVFNLDNEKALADLNLADAQLQIITEMLATPTPTATEEEPEPKTFPFGYPEEEQQMIREDNSNQNQTNSSSSTQPLTLPPLPTPEPQPQPQPQPEPEPVQQQEPTIKIPLNKTQQELVTIEEIAGINKTTHEKTTISIIEGNKTTHRDVTTTEVPIK